MKYTASEDIKAGDPVVLCDDGTVKRGKRSLEDILRDTWRYDYPTDWPEIAAKAKEVLLDVSDEELWRFLEIRYGDIPHNRPIDVLRRFLNYLKEGV